MTSLKPFTIFQGLCSKIRNLQQNNLDRLKIRRSLVTGDVQLQCLLERMNEYLRVGILISQFSSFKSFPCMKVK